MNNFIISSPQKIEVVEYPPAKAQIIPKLNTTALIHFHQSVNTFPPEINHPVKRIITVKKIDNSTEILKKISPRPTSTRNNKSTITPKKLLQNNTIISNKQKDKGVSLLYKSKSGPIKMKVGSKAEPPKGETSEQPHGPKKISPKHPIKKNRAPTPGTFMKITNATGIIRNITILSVKKPNPSPKTGKRNNEPRKEISVKTNRIKNCYK